MTEASSPREEPDGRAMLRHQLAGLAYRFTHALADAPIGFETFELGHGVRTPLELLHHIAAVLDHGRSHLVPAADEESDGAGSDASASGPSDERAGVASPWVQAIDEVYRSLERFDAVVLDPTSTNDHGRVDAVVQGPLMDAASHIGQLALLRRAFGAPVAPVSYVRAEVHAGQLRPDARVLLRADRRRTLARALYFGQAWRIEALVDDDPDLAGDDAALRIALFDDDWTLAWLDADTDRATRPLGRRTPLLHLAFSQRLRSAPTARDAMLRIAQRLLDLGADPNDAFVPDPADPYRLSALYGAIGHAGNLPLARLLLERGADPNDGESLYHGTELSDASGLRLLLEHGADPAGTNALLRALDLGDPDKVRALLDAGADPNEAVVQHGEGIPAVGVTPLQQAARRDAPAESVGLLLDAGADAARRWGGHAPYATACIHGSDEVARTLEERGVAEPLTALETILARCAEGVAPDAPIDANEAGAEDRRLPVRIAAVPGRTAHLRALLDAGLDPNVVDEMGLTPLHVALWEGLPDQVELLLDRTPDLAHVNAHGGDALGTLIHGAEFCPAPDRDHLACARLLLAAGSRAPTQDEIEACGDEELVALLRERPRSP